MIYLPGHLIVGIGGASLQILYSNKYNIFLYTNFRTSTTALVINK